MVEAGEDSWLVESLITSLANLSFSFIAAEAEPPVTRPGAKRALEGQLQSGCEKRLAHVVNMSSIYQTVLSTKPPATTDENSPVLAAELCL